jgi:predicted kinase
MVTKVLIMMSGVPGSGKSTWARKQAPLMPSPIIVSRDDIRKSLTKPGDSYFAHESKVFNTYAYMISSALNSDHFETVFADATQINWISRKKLIDALIIKEGVDVVYVLVNMDTSLPECLIRNTEREDIVPDKAIFSMDKRHTIEEPDYKFFDCIYNIKENGVWEEIKNGEVRALNSDISSSV